MSKKRDGSTGRDGVTRRDFLDGVAIGAAGLAAAAASPHLTGAEAAIAGHGGTSKPLPPGYYPPTSTGITGQPNNVIRDTMKIDGRPDPDHVHSTHGGPGIFTYNARDVDDDYDLVVVGAGASGIAAAKWYRDRFGPDSKILLIDSLPDFGGHSHRNEFHSPDASSGGADVMLLRNGGTVNLDSIGTWNQDGPSGIPGSYGQPAIDFLDWAGVDTATGSKWQNGGASGIPSSYGLYQRLLFPSAEFGTDHVIAARNAGPFAGQEPGTVAGWTAFLARTPYSAAAREGILRVQTSNDDFLANAPGALT